MDREVMTDRLNTQRQRILERLQYGPVTNLELNHLAFRYSARIHELRQAWHPIRLTHQDRVTGVSTYALGEVAAAA